MTPPDLRTLRREVVIAQSAYTHAHDTYWTTRHDAAVFQVWHATAIRLDQALDALLAALPPHDPECDHVAEAQARLHQEIARVHERAMLEAVRATT